MNARMVVEAMEVKMLSRNSFDYVAITMMEYSSMVRERTSFI
jgi:hypothetical protein